MTCAYFDVGHCNTRSDDTQIGFDSLLVTDFGFGFTSGSECRNPTEVICIKKTSWAAWAFDSTIDNVYYHDDCFWSAESGGMMNPPSHDFVS